MDNIFLSSFICFLVFLVCLNILLYAKFIKNDKEKSFVDEEIQKKNGNNRLFVFFLILTIVFFIIDLICFIDNYNVIINSGYDTLTNGEPSWGEEPSKYIFNTYDIKNLKGNVLFTWIASQSLSCVFIVLFFYFLLKFKKKKVLYLFLLDVFLCLIFGNLILLFLFI